MYNPDITYLSTVQHGGQSTYFLAKWSAKLDFFILNISDWNVLCVAVHKCKKEQLNTIIKCYLQGSHNFCQIYKSEQTFRQGFYSI